MLPLLHGMLKAFSWAKRVGRRKIRSEHWLGHSALGFGKHLNDSLVNSLSFPLAQCTL